MTAAFNAVKAAVVVASGANRAINEAEFNLRFADAMNALATLKGEMLAMQALNDDLERRLGV